MILAQSYHCIGIGTYGTCTGTDDTGMSFDGTGTGTEGTDSTSTDAYDSGTILYISFSLMDSEVICNPKNYQSLTHSVNNIGLRDASLKRLSLTHSMTDY